MKSKFKYYVSKGYKCKVLILVSILYIEFNIINYTLFLFFIIFFNENVNFINLFTSIF